MLPGLENEEDRKAQRAQRKTKRKNLRKAGNSGKRTRGGKPPEAPLGVTSRPDSVGRQKGISTK